MTMVLVILAIIGASILGILGIIALIRTIRTERKIDKGLFILSMISAGYFIWQLVDFIIENRAVFGQ